ncbi:signal recognition particle subunit Srp14p [[Candida] jaroonii]|uniref:Signal recognition particle subunit Srp14p n=1 Tax=[Candida] jaroonii TaxID=467808 RepID=A0ACA9YDW7_9ASCO|nr:signal recognition particle subunit Srp14p [[Candida] jaroonii]
MGRLNNAEFLSQFAETLTKNNGESSVYLTQKRLVPSLDVEDNKGINDLSSNVIDHKLFDKNTQEYPILIRLSMNGKNKDKLKLSTVVEIDQLDQFWIDYAQTIKAGFVGLKKKDKKKSKKKVSK